MFERFTERARQVVVLAQDEARELRHNYIGTEHLLLGLLRERQGGAAQIRETFAVTLDGVRAQVARIVGQGDEVATGQIPFTPRAKKVLELALREKQTLGRTDIGTEHLPPRPVSRPHPPAQRRRRRSPVPLVAVSSALGAVTLGLGILIGWAIWG